MTEAAHVAVLPDGAGRHSAAGRDVGGPTRRAPLGAATRARSGDKGGTANVGVCTRSEDAAEWLVAFVAERTAPYKRARQVEFIEAVPKSASGKILRRELRVKDKAGS